MIETALNLPSLAASSRDSADAFTCTAPLPGSLELHGIVLMGAADGVGSAEPHGRLLLFYQAISLFGFASLNIGLNFYNSWALKDNSDGPMFVFPIFYTMFHMIASALGATALLIYRKPATGYPSFAQLWEYKWGLLPIAACTTVNIGCNNVSLTLISLFLNQVVKATAPMPTMLFSFILEGKKFTWPLIATCGVIVAGTILAVPMKSNGASTSVGGVIIVVLSTTAASLKPVIMTLVFNGATHRPKLAPMIVLFYDSAISFWFMLIYWLVSPERTGSIDYIARQPALALVVIAVGAIMSFVFNISTYFYVQFTSALTSVIASNGVKVINIVISALTSHVSELRNWVGVSVVCGALCAYAYASRLPKPQPPKGDTEAGHAPSEATLLNPSAEKGGLSSCCVIL